MYKVAVMGDYDSIYGFGALGLDIFPVDDALEATKILHRLAGGNYAIVYITESLADKINEEIKKYSEQISPAIILIPGVQKNTGAGVQRVKDTVEQAIGSDIVFGNK
jgi:V/A-type H+-transporting ATPase subunit F